MLLAAHELGCVRPAALIAALTQGRNLLRRPEGRQMQEDRGDLLGENAESDFFILMRAHRFAEQRNFNPQACRPLGINALAAREAAALADQFLRIAKDEKLNVDSRETTDEALQRCILAGFPDMVAMRLDSGTLRCALVHARKGVLARESVVGTPLLVASEVREVEIRGGRGNAAHAGHRDPRGMAARAFSRRLCGNHGGLFRFLAAAGAGETPDPFSRSRPARRAIG